MFSNTHIVSYYFKVRKKTVPGPRKKILSNLVENVETQETLISGIVLNVFKCPNELILNILCTYNFQNI